MLGCLASKCNFFLATVQMNPYQILFGLTVSWPMAQGTLASDAVNAASPMKGGYAERRTELHCDVTHDVALHGRHQRRTVPSSRRQSPSVYSGSSIERADDTTAGGRRTSRAARPHPCSSRQSNHAVSNALSAFNIAMSTAGEADRASFKSDLHGTLRAATQERQTWRRCPRRSPGATWTNTLARHREPVAPLEDLIRIEAVG